MAVIHDIDVEFNLDDHYQHFDEPDAIHIAIDESFYKLDLTVNEPDTVYQYLAIYVALHQQHVTVDQCHGINVCLAICFDKLHQSVHKFDAEYQHHRLHVDFDEQHQPEHEPDAIDLYFAICFYIEHQPVHEPDTVHKYLAIDLNFHKLNLTVNEHYTEYQRHAIYIDKQYQSIYQSDCLKLHKYF